MSLSSNRLLKNSISQAKACGYQKQLIAFPQVAHTLQGALFLIQAFFNNLLKNLRDR
jgi:hypothetical protein